MLDAITGFHLELTNMCTVKCPRCPRTQMIERFPNKWKNKNIELSDLEKFLDIDLSGKSFTLCGSYGDPIYHPNLIEIINWIKQKGGLVFLETNGSYKSKVWWEQVVENLTPADKVTFSIDGTPENFTQYRVNADWNSIRTGIQVVTASNAKAVWKYIRFKYNQHNIDEVRSLATQMGVDEFELVESDRWIEDDPFKPDITPIEKKIVWRTASVIDPLCIKKNNFHYISADGYYLPCAWVASPEFLYKTDLWKRREDYSIKKTTISNILTSHLGDFYKTLVTDQQAHCKYQCSGN